MEKKRICELAPIFFLPFTLVFSPSFYHSALSLFSLCGAADLGFFFYTFPFSAASKVEINTDIRTHDDIAKDHVLFSQEQQQKKVSH